MSLAESALDYAGAGWEVFPVKEKHPLTEHGFHEASSDPMQLIEWWSRWPEANVGAAVPETMAVVDVDAASGGLSTLRALDAQHGVPETRASLTGGGGLHYFYLHPGGELRQGAGILGRGIDTRIPGKGYVVLPPSIHPSGRAYEWYDRSAPLLILPEWMERQLRPAPPGRRAEWHGSGDESKRLAALAQKVATAREGERNAVLNWAAFTARDIPDPRRVAETLVDAATAAGLPEREARRTISSGLGMTQ